MTSLHYYVKIDFEKHKNQLIGLRPTLDTWLVEATHCPKLTAISSSQGRIRNKARQQDDAPLPPKVAHILDILLTLYYLNIFLKYQNTRSFKPNPDPGPAKRFWYKSGKNEIIPNDDRIKPNQPRISRNNSFP